MNFSTSFITPEQLQKYLPLALVLLFTALLGLKLAELTWLLVPEPEGGAWQARPSASVNAPKKPAQQLDVSDLLAAKLFGEETAQEAAEIPFAESLDAPDTNLRLSLRGIFAMEIATQSRALIEAANGDLQSYAIGMNVPGGAKLHAIYPDRVLLQRAGRLETLRLEKDKPTSQAASSIAEQNRSISRNRAGTNNQISGDVAAKLASIRTELLNDPTKASQYLRVQPARRNGELRGYRIYPGRKRELFREAGLRPGDIVTSVNGVELNDPSKSLQMLGDLSQAPQINLQVERGGSSHSISVSLN